METSILFPMREPDFTDVGDIRPFSTYNSSTERRREIWAVVAMGRNGEMGFEGDMPWHIPEDLRHFKQLTMGHPVIMGRTTWLSIPKRPLPGRRNIVLSRSADFKAEGAETVSSLAEAIAVSPPPEIPVIIGGGSVYKESLSIVSRVYATIIDAEFPQADTYFPNLEEAGFKAVESSEIMVSASGLKLQFVTFER